MKWPAADHQGQDAGCRRARHLHPQGNSGVFDGSFTIRRADFTIGEGAWAKFDIVANDVQIKFRITANSK
jgi:polyisoprenoid-binding protein YceI